MHDEAGEAPVRVAFILDSLAIGGTEMHVRTLLRHLDRGRVAPVVILSPAARRTGLDRMLEDAGAAVVVHAMPCDKGDVRTLAGLVRLLRRLSPAIVHVILPYTLDNRYAFLAARIARCPVVISTEQLASEPVVFRSVRARAIKRVLAGLQDCIIASSDQVRDRLIQLAGIPSAKIVTVHNAVEIPEIRSTPADDMRRELGLGRATPLVGMVARIDLKQKRYQEFLMAAPKVACAMPGARFLIVGDGEEAERTALEQQARDLGLGARVHFLGFRPDVSRVIAALDVLVLASANEGFPLVTLEAMAHGVPVVATDLGALREQIVHGENGFLVPPGDVAALANSVAALLLDPARASQMGQRARRLVEQRFDVQDMATTVQALYLRLLARRRALRSVGDSFPRVS